MKIDVLSKNTTCGVLENIWMHRQLFFVKIYCCLQERIYQQHYTKYYTQLHISESRFIKPVWFTIKSPQQSFIHTGIMSNNVSHCNMPLHAYSCLFMHLLSRPIKTANNCDKETTHFSCPIPINIHLNIVKCGILLPPN